MVLTLLLLMIALPLYMMPGIIALKRGHVNAIPITLTNLFFGWTVVGWAIALIWAFANQTAMTPAPAPHPGPAEAKVRRKPLHRYIKYGLWTFAVLIVLFFVSMVLVPAGKSGNDPRMGVPVPAEQVFGQ